jgi:signal transduction histidine kinase
MMISYVNHEIRNPLQTILGLADVELEEANEPE